MNRIAYHDTKKKQTSTERRKTASAKTPQQMRTAAANLTGIPDMMKTRFENMSGFSFDDVRVHYHSDKPAQFQALAYTQSNQVYVAPGQEKHLGHELGHVVQQKSGLVHETERISDTPVNLDPELEKQADRMADAPATSADHTDKLRFVSGQTNVLQAVLVINHMTFPPRTERVTPYSSSLRVLYDTVVIPFLNERNYRSYGILTQLRQYVVQDRRFNSHEAFLQDFERYLQGQSRDVRGGRSVPVLRFFEVSRMSRPAWPTHLRDRLHARAIHAGSQLNIRHVIRNATLRHALDIYARIHGNEGLARLAGDFGIRASAIDACVRGLYRLLYLNEDNLWSGEGLVNQIIGFLATPLQQYGQRISSGSEPYSGNRLVEIMLHSTQMIRGDIDRRVAVLRELYSIINNCAADNPDIGEMIEDIGLSLGFDFVNDDTQALQLRQRNLIASETALQRYIISNGTTGDLRQILHSFLGRSGTASRPIATETEAGSPSIRVSVDESETERMLETASQDSTQRVAHGALTSYAHNNCLIHAIADAMGVARPADLALYMIRLNLHNAGVADFGDLLDGGCAETVLIICHALGIDLHQRGLRIYQDGRPVAEYGTRLVYSNILFAGGHFMAINPVPRFG